MRDRRLPLANPRGRRVHPYALPLRRLRVAFDPPARRRGGGSPRRRFARLPIILPLCTNRNATHLWSSSHGVALRTRSSLANHQPPLLKAGNPPASATAAICPARRPTLRCSVPPPAPESACRIVCLELISRPPHFILKPPRAPRVGWYKYGRGSFVLLCVRGSNTLAHPADLLVATEGSQLGSSPCEISTHVAARAAYALTNCLPSVHRCHRAVPSFLPQHPLLPTCYIGGCQ